MKTLINLSTSTYDLDRFTSPQALVSLLAELDFDGVELLACDEDPRGIVTADLVIGQHMIFFPYWLDFFLGDEAALIREFGSLNECERVYGGTDKRALIARFRADFLKAERYGAEYVVFHVSDAGVAEAIRGRYRHSSEEVIDATCVLMEEVFRGMQYRPLLLLENLWQPGLTLTEPEMTRRLLEGVPYESVGFMLDTGHLFHTNDEIRTQEEGLAYIHAMLDAHGELARRIYGMHLHQSITGTVSKAMREHPPALADTYQARASQMLEYAFRIDQHRPFTCLGVGELVERIHPAYLTFEFMSENTIQHRTLLKEQKKALEQRIRV